MNINIVADFRTGNTLCKTKIEISNKRSTSFTFLSLSLPLQSGLLKRFLISLAFGNRHLSGKKESNLCYILKSDDPQAEAMQTINNMKQDHHKRSRASEACSERVSQNLCVGRIRIRIRNSEIGFENPIRKSEIENPNIGNCHNRVKLTNNGIL